MKKFKNRWKKLDSKVVYKNPWTSFREDKVTTPDGKNGIYGYLDQLPAVFLVSITDKGEMILINLHRYTVMEYSWEIPAGSIEGKESVLSASKRELLEETGYKAKKWTNLNYVYSYNGHSNQKQYTLIAQDLTQTESDKRAEEGITEIEKVPIKKVIKMLKSGEIKDGQSILAIMRALLYLGYVK